ncbi:MAG: hypothetical protein OQK52_10650 [Ignavibacteriaceae bacterium]|jgi:hypothetical protein|nr:hypothetical protein [Ignavibacteriaceae bacterium]MCW8812686.1 hypothetical protein [Chlorobium sp.]MCW8818320.1 hypothetical protein [Ignavibacteriaceae bacterium]MCW8823530.1 hypothetical protein [Ignavibacteriaceae bacterium]MCW8995548.1 hypothetical protein [Psychromonas sp.]
MKQKIYPEEVVNYLKDKAIKKWELEWIEVSGIDQVIVVPAICEFPNIKNLLSSLIKNDRSILHKSLVIFVINNSASSSHEIKEDNKKSLSLMRAIINGSNSDKFVYEISKSGIQIGVLDAALEGKEFKDKQAGVGLARKIGLDQALKVFDYSNPNKKILISLDADCTVEKNYIKEIRSFFNMQNISVANIDFEHNLESEKNNIRGIVSYEIYLRHYVVGLLFAMSPYSFHTIGSTLVCDHEAYIKAGGMNTRKAAEDFYFLQKLAKHYKIHKITSAKVKPSARESWRVPFGTGKSMTDYLTGKKEILLYDPDKYIVLKEWLELLNSDLSLNTNIILNEAKKIHCELFNFLESRGFSKDWDQILSNSKSEKQLNYQRKNWFDAFKTLKLMHHLRDTSFPMVDIKSGVEKLFNMVGHTIEIEDDKNNNNFYEEYLSELKLVEHSLTKNLVN